MATELLVGSPIVRQMGNALRASASVDGTEAWFESEDIPLGPSSEAFASAFLLAAADARRRLAVSEPVAADWAGGAAQVLETAHRWWGYPRLWPRLDTRPVASGPQRGGERRGLCFTGGVDSFFSLLVCGGPIQYLIHAHGFDVRLEDEHRAAGMAARFREIAEATSTRLVTIRTNLRTHPAFAPVPWPRTHGGALAALGHLCAGTIDTLVISSSGTYAAPKPWGSHWELDPCWSGAGLSIEHVGAEYSRNAKLRLIAHSPLVRRHLHVCWEHRDDRLNCSRCEKCLRTRSVLAGLGVLQDFAVLDGPETLAADLDALPCVTVPSRWRRYREALADGGLSRDVSRAIERLLVRSRTHLWRRRIGALSQPARAVIRRLTPRPGSVRVINPPQ
ncbi:MAG TPA: hypothetical protein VFL88_02750 [Gemmatimonadales bacterium]|nr:hypothetical protein [Gemmatimonadales bacterium]